MFKKLPYINDMLSFFRKADISLFHDFEPPPTGGGHQFMRALQQQLINRGFRVENNTVTPTTRACLFNSFNFNHQRLLRIKKHRTTCKLIHRVDGPISVYRGYDDGTDSLIDQVNNTLADVTVFQSRYSLAMSKKIGMSLRQPHVIIPNSPDPTIFHARGREEFDQNRKIRLVSTAWSDNPNKGLEIYKWLDRNLDWTKYEYIFIGRIKAELENITHIQPTDSPTIASHLRKSDIFITASRNDPCSNSLLEALACGLPAVYLDSGGHRELVKEAGIAFVQPGDIPDQLLEISNNYKTFQSKISLASIDEITQQYLDVMEIEHG
ncbi:glycosyltransferase family 4 protein [Desulfobulbus alkaliphilus]|uniref:glycosyltransferase family 4 protein n=1 Tax=Desulfobulbus alkaliphilus TaxID=869814 RepID=UPI00196318FA|nr:glycosyltransferase family 4 protein [Desulfobulbus alkaliphilus]MBM9538199.1 glycosyltransferase family 4 protein [Desulfobulbus alkaliphilus]